MSTRLETGCLWLSRSQFLWPPAASAPCLPIRPSAPGIPRFETIVTPPSWSSVRFGRRSTYSWGRPRGWSGRVVDRPKVRSAEALFGRNCC